MALLTRPAWHTRSRHDWREGEPRAVRPKKSMIPNGPWCYGLSRSPGASRGVRGRQGHLELHPHLVLQLERAEEPDVRLDPESRLDHRGRAAKPAGLRLGHLQPDRLALPVKGERALDGAAAGAETDDLGGGEAGRAGAEDPVQLLLDVGAVPVAERLGAAGALADLQRAEVELCLHRRRGEAARVVVRHLDPRRPAGDFEGQVVAGPGGEAGPAGLEHHASVVRPEPEVTRNSSHGPTVRARRAAVHWDRGQGSGKSPNSSRIRRRSRSRGSVVPPTQRLTVLTETPSWRAATSMVMPSRRSAAAIQSAKAVSSSFRLAPGGSAPNLPGSWDLSSEARASRPAGVPIWAPERSTSTSTWSGKIRKETLIAPVSPAASSRAWATVSPTSRLSSSDSGDCCRQRRTKSRMSGMDDGRAGNVCDRTTTGTTSMLSLIKSAGFSIATPRVGQRW